MNTIEFDDGRCPKHEMDIFPTVRRDDSFGKQSEVVRINNAEDESFMGLAMIVSKEYKMLNEMPKPFLKYDTDEEVWEEAVRSLQSYYADPITPKEELIIYWLRWVKP